MAVADDGGKDVVEVMGDPAGQEALHARCFPHFVFQDLDGAQWLLILEGIPPILFGFITYFVLPNRPQEAGFLTTEEKEWIQTELKSEEQEKLRHRQYSVLETLTNGRVWHLILLYSGLMVGRYTMSFWTPQIIKSLSSGYSNTTVGLLVMIPSLVAAAAMVLISRSSDRRLERKFHAAIPILGAALALALLGTTRSPFYAVALRIHEQRDVPDERPPDDRHAEQLAAREDHSIQNPFIAAGSIKPGRFRLLTTMGVLWIANYAVRHIFNRANLAGVKTIHFARWVFLDGRRRVVFASSYDGSVESYMDDFIDKVWWGLNAVFSNGVGYPRTRWLLFGGARDERAFKRVLRRRQEPVQVFYSAYPDLTALNLQNNRELRAGLIGSMTESQATAWLARL
jgi:hypothetical protein